MDQPAWLKSVQAPRRRRRNGFLLVEAALTAAVLAIGLIAITQGIGSSLRALSTIQRYEALLHVTESKLAELEVQAQQGQPLKADESWQPLGSAYQWKLSKAEVSSLNIPKDIQSSVWLVTLTVSPKDSGQPQVHLKTIWPVEWLQP